MRFWSSSLLALSYYAWMSSLSFLSVIHAQEQEEVVVENEDDYNADTAIQNMIDWLRSEEQGGYMNDKLEIRRRTDDSDEFGIFAKSDIHRHERLLYIPADVMIHGAATEDYDDDICNLAYIVLEEIELGDESEYEPYISYLQTKSEGHIPPTFSDQGKQLLEMIIGFGYEMGKFGWKESILPPNYLTTFGEAECTTTPSAQYAIELVEKQRFGRVMVPVFDMINHHNNPTKLNTEIASSFYDEEGLKLDASRDIHVGEELYISYNNCNGCERRSYQWGTADLFRDYGFVEDYPRRWNFSRQKLAFDIQYSADENEDYKLVWRNGRKPTKNIHKKLETMQDEYQRLDEIGKLDIPQAYEEEVIPKFELDLIAKYHDALSTAIGMAAKALQDMIITMKNNDDENTKRTTSLLLQDDEEPNASDVAVATVDDFLRKIYQYETLTKAMYEYKHLETVHSHYQKIEYYQHIKNSNGCFYLDEIFQICESYWPHYHEMFVHKPAKYIKGDVKRLLWVGGGDSGLLNEIVKYPSLELAVGLELDQKVTRGAFKYFGAKPHFNNPKVQWWFGDASKSLLMLPVEYFGTFDMVMVDLSDTVLAFSVSKKLDIFSALSLLLKPDGLFVMNELFFKGVSDVFEYTINYNFLDVPEIGDQSYMIGSNVVDFLHTPLTDHEILDELHVENSTYKTEHQFDMIHDYRRNPNYTYKNLCKADGEEDDDDNLHEQEASPGIIMIVEAENVSADLSSIGNVKTSVTDALESVGFGVLTVSALPPSENAYAETARNFALILKEGYVVVRTWPDHRHVSFDIHLWSSFGKHEAAKKALVSAVGGTMDSVTSYRIVAGGMFGVSTWKDDVKSRGPKVTQKCEEPTALQKALSNTDAESTTVAIKAGMSLVKDDNPVIAVLCGYETNPCTSIELLEKDNNVKEVIPLYTCLGLMADDQSFEDRQNAFFNCKESIVTSLHKAFAGEDRKLSAIVLDKSAPKEMGKMIGQILFRIFRGQKGAPEGVLSDRLLMLATVEEDSEGWRRKLLNVVREKIIVADPLFGCRVFLNSSDSSIELHVTSSGDDLFVEHLVDMVSTVESESGLSLEIRNILGGYWSSHKKYSITEADSPGLFLFKDFQQEQSLRQWKSQQPLGYQTVFQLNQGTHYNVGDNVHAFVQEDQRWFFGTVAHANYVDDIYDVQFSNDEILALSISDLRSEIEWGQENYLKINSKLIASSLRNSLAEIRNQKIPDLVDIYSANNVGDGSVFVALWSGGIVVTVWDGKNQVCINLFTYKESREFADKFILSFKQSEGNLTTFARDEQPRGKGHIINFSKDIFPREVPQWA